MRLSDGFLRGHESDEDLTEPLFTRLITRTRKQGFQVIYERSDAEGIRVALLEEIFEEFCNRLEGKLRWGRQRKKFSDAVFDFFLVLAKKKGNVSVEREYCRIDRIWRSKGNSHHIVLALEHENICKIEEFLTKEIQHLIDVKAENKIAITYPAQGDAKDLIQTIQNMIRANPLRLSTSEKYLIVFGFRTWKTIDGRKRRVILFKAYYIGPDGETLDTDERILLQGRRTFTLTVQAIDDRGRELRVPFRLERVR